MKKLSALTIAVALASSTAAMANVNYYFDDLSQFRAIRGQNNFPYSSITNGNGYNAPILVSQKYKTTVSNQHGFGGYRIPGIVALGNGTLITVADKRYANTGGNTDIIGNGGVQNKVEFAVKVSHDGGMNWSNEILLSPSDKDPKNPWTGSITDPQIVVNKDTKETIIIGYRNDTHVNASKGNWDMFTYTSNDDGKSWKEHKITDQIKLAKGFHHALQGPGNSIYYKGKYYVAIQQWTQGKATAGMISSSDGIHWETSSMLISDANNIQNGFDTISGNPITSESNLFHHKGYIYLAAKSETSNSPKRRYAFRTKDDGKTWEQVDEDFLPHDVMSICQTSSYALNDDVYFVGYSTNIQGASGSRHATWITSNTGYKIQLFIDKDLTGGLNGYSSIASDDDNLYVFFEGANDGNAADKYSSAMLLSKFDIAHKDYANLNAQLIDRARDQFYLQNSMRTEESYIKGSYGSESNYGVEAVAKFERANIGLFHQESKDNSDDIARTISYDEKRTSILVSTNELLFNDKSLNDAFYVGYQLAQVDYKNNAKDKVNSALLGYNLNYSHEYFDYSLSLNGMFSKHDFERNNYEGIGKNAEFNSLTASIKNEFSKTFDIEEAMNTKVKPYGGLETVYFKHDAFSEENGNNFNDITVNETKEYSNQLYLGVNASNSFDLGNNVKLSLLADIKVKKELTSHDKFQDSYYMFGEKFYFANPIKDKSIIFEGNVGASLEFNERLGLSIGYALDTLDENYGYISGKIKF